VILSHDDAGFSPMASPPNPAAVPIVTYEYLFCFPLSDRLRPPTQRKAQGLLAGSCISGYCESLVTAQKFGCVWFPLAANDEGTKYPILDTAPPLLVEEEGPPT
jgi:hypothetical protein